MTDFQGKVLEWEAILPVRANGTHCGSPVYRNPLPDMGSDALPTQSTPFTQAFFGCLWEWWETEAASIRFLTVFQMPSIAQLVFRKLSLRATFMLSTISAVFPLFLRELRVLLSFF
jgi:hypothetical protein